MPRFQTATGLFFKMIMITLGHTGTFQIEDSFGFTVEIRN